MEKQIIGQQTIVIDEIHMLGIIEDEMVECEECGELHSKDEMEEIDGDFYCIECRDRDFIFCRECEEWESRNNSTWDAVNENYICETCMEDMTTCEDCGEIVNNDDSNCVNPNSNDVKYVCDGCLESSEYYKCDDCGDYYTRDNMTYYGGNRDICDNCGDEYGRCDDCGDVEHCDNLYYNDDCENSYCETCYDSHRESDNLYDYDHKPRPIFYNTEEDEKNEEKNPLFLGLELEIDNGREKSQMVDNISEELDFTYCKKDGSLDDGFEIVSHPCSLNFHSSQKENYSDVFRDCVSNEWKGHDATTCGYHIHANRTFFGDSEQEQDLHIAKLMLLVNSLWDNGLVKFTRRTQGQLNQWAKRFGEIDGQEGEVDVLIDTCKKQRGRYYAINLSNDNTVEFRLYRSTLNINTFMATLQFTSNICNLVKETKLVDILKITMQDVIGYKEYEELNTYSKERGL